MDNEIRFKFVITPAIPPEERHQIQDALKKLGYKITGGGTDTDMSECDISFEKTEPVSTHTNHTGLTGIKDGHKCVKCDATDNLVGHHIVGITLCVDCHKLVHKDDGWQVGAGEKSLNRKIIYNYREIR